MGVFLTTLRRISFNPSSVSAAPISRAVSRISSNWGLSSGGGGLRAGISGELSIHRKLTLTFWARKYSMSNLHPSSSLQDRLFAALISGGTYGMRWLAISHAALLDVRKIPLMGNAGKFVALLLCT